MSTSSYRFMMGELREMAFGSITNGYTAIGTGFGNSSLQFIVQNNTDVRIYFSIDGGTKNNFSLPPYSIWNSDVSANEQVGGPVKLPIGTVFSVKYGSAAPTLGYVEINNCYAG